LNFVNCSILKTLKDALLTEGWVIRLARWAFRLPLGMVFKTGAEKAVERMNLAT